MKRLSLAILLISGIGFTLAARAQGMTPFAQQSHRPGADTQLLSLGDLMIVSQWRHMKLWQAAKAENWALAKYEADKLSESLYRAAVLYVNIPAPLVKTSDAQLAAIADAALQRDQRGFEQAFVALTTSCNACHQAAGLDFIRMRMPTSSPFSDQDFTAPTKNR